MILKPLDINHRELFKNYIVHDSLTTSDIVFTNLYIWRLHYNVVIGECEDCLCILSNINSPNAFAFPPIGKGDKLAAIEKMFSLLENPILKRAPESLAQQIAALRPGWLIEHDINNDDYVYETERLINLSGRKMHQKKNHFNYFIKNYNYSCEEVRPDIYDEIFALEKKWLETKSGLEHELLVGELDSLNQLLINLNTLEQKTMAIRINGCIEAFTMGEYLNSQTALIHVEKANPEIRGLYVALLSLFCKEQFSDTVYINREQDLGIDGLRQSKESLKPIHMEKKYNISPK